MRTKLLISVLASAGLLTVACDNDAGSNGNTGASGTNGDDTEGGGGTSVSAGDDDGDGGDGAEDDDGPEPTTAGTDDGGDDDGPGFINVVDSGAVSIECSVWTQDCSEGEKCMPWANDGGSAWNATRCSPLDPSPGQPGDDCTVEGSGVSGVDSCDVASMCWGVNAETGLGRCVSFCTGSQASPSCDDPNAACSIANDGVLILCLPRCDPLVQDCTDDEACYGIDQSFVCAPNASGESGSFGDPCEFINACDPGLGCVAAAAVPNCVGSVGCCSTFCDSSNPNASANCPGAAGGQDCVSYFEEGNAPPGYEDVGICLIPN